MFVIFQIRQCFKIDSRLYHVIDVFPSIRAWCHSFNASDFTVWCTQSAARLCVFVKSRSFSVFCFSTYFPTVSHSLSPWSLSRLILILFFISLLASYSPSSFSPLYSSLVLVLSFILISSSSLFQPSRLQFLFFAIFFLCYLSLPIACLFSLFLFFFKSSSSIRLLSLEFLLSSLILFYFPFSRFLLFSLLDIVISSSVFFHVFSLRLSSLFLSVLFSSLSSLSPSLVLSLFCLFCSYPFFPYSLPRLSLPQILCLTLSTYFKQTLCSFNYCLTIFSMLFL